MTFLWLKIFHVSTEKLVGSKKGHKIRKAITEYFQEKTTKKCLKAEDLTANH